MMRSLRDSIRFLRTDPGFSTIAIFILTIGIGVTSAIFSFVNALLVKPLPFPESDLLVRIESVQGGVAGKVMPREWEALDHDRLVFEGMAAWYPSQYNLSVDGRPEVVRACMTTANLFRVLGVDLSQGSTWQAGTHRQRNPSVVLGHDLWKQRLGGDMAILNRSLIMDAAPYLVTGIAPSGFQFPVRTDVYRAAHLGGAQNEAVRSLSIVGRLKRGVSIAQAQERLRVFASEQARTWPATNTGISFRVTPLRDAYVGDIRPYLILTLALAIVVLLIACVNVAALLLSRGMARSREMAIRVALGAERRHILGQVLSESVALNLAGGFLGVGFAWFAVAALSRMLRADLPSWMAVQIDARVLLFTLVISIASGVLAGLYPAFAVSRQNTEQSLREGAKGGGGSRRQARLRRALISAEICLSVVLLIAAGLLARSFMKLQEFDTGFRRTQLITFRTDPPWSRYNTAAQTSQFYRVAQAELESIPGVHAAAANHSFPLALNQNYGKPTVLVEGQGVDEQKSNPFVNVQIVSPNYLGVMGVPVIAGRGFTTEDRLGSTPSAVLSRPLATRLFGKEDPIGRRLRLPELLGSLTNKQEDWFTIVGVAEGVRSESLTSAPGLDIYLSNQQQFAGDTFFVLRTSEPVAAIMQRAEAAIRRVDPDQPIFGIRTVEDLVEETVWHRKLAGRLSIAFGGIALLLAALGTYGLLSWTVSQRMRELAVRQALGSTPTQIQRLVVGEGLRVAMIGVAAGLCVALPVVWSFARLLFGVRVWDPVSLVVAIFFATGFTVLASLVPAVRASKVAPHAVLKSD
jgi:putative ABC transport system permease protein